ncbi:MAG: EAL domain-containing protein [Pseudomonadales bacterium]
MSDKDNIRLIIADASANRAQELESLLRNAGHSTRSEHVGSCEAFAAALERGSWDLCICRNTEADYAPKDILDLIRKLDLEIPVILLEETSDPECLTTGLAMGAADVILDDEDQRLLLVFARELKNLGERKERQRADQTLAESERRCQLLLDTSSAAIAYVHEGMHIYANHAYLKLFGYEDIDDLMAVPLLDMLDEASQQELKSRMKSPESPESQGSFAIKGEASDGSIVDAHAMLSGAVYDGEACMQILIREEVGEPSGELQAKIDEIASQDLLTGLNNRAHFLRTLESTIEKNKTGGTPSAAYYLNLDKFTDLKSDFGINNADIVLTDVATALRSVAPKSAVLCRFSDDVFTAIVHDVNAEKAIAMGEEFRHAIDENLSDVGGRTAQVTASVGVALVDDSGSSPQDTLQQIHHASNAVRVTNKDGNGVHFYDAKEVEEKRRADTIAGGGDDALIARIDHALRENAFQLVFQPFISLRGDPEEHYEVFVRMLDEDDNPIAPGEFMPLAANTGVGGKIDRWVILQSIKILSVHRSKGHDTRLMINLTPNSVSDTSFLPWLSVAIKAARLPSDAVIFQLYEDDAITYLKQARDFTNGLKELHCRASLSHFGRSDNPFGTLKHLNVDFVKIDGAYVQNIDRKEDKRKALGELIGSLQAQGKLSIVPMVETAAVLASLWQAGANYIQGNYLQEPTSEMDYDFTTED